MRKKEGEKPRGEAERRTRLGGGNNTSGMAEKPSTRWCAEKAVCADRGNGGRIRLGEENWHRRPERGVHKC
jgi:hypothetical protein